MLALLLLYISKVQPQEISTPASLLGPEHFNYHAYRLSPEDINPTKKGPVLFPNDSPPPPRPPLVVTSRPILESIARSELNPLPQNSTETKQNDKDFDESASDSNISNNPYQNFVDVDSIGLNPETQASSYSVPYSGVLRNRFYDYPDINKGYYNKQSITLPPIYKAISDNANRELVKLRQKPMRFNTQENDYDNYDDKQSQEENNYAFSYRVNDHITGDDFSHSQRSSSSGTSGEYRVKLPDGRTQIVSYTADENGYKADVRYEEEIQTHKQQDNLNYIQKQKQIDYSSKNYYDTNTNYKYNPKYQQNSYTSDTNDYPDDFQYESNNPYHSKFSIYDPKFSTIRPITTNELTDSVKFESSTKSVYVANGNIYTTVKPSLQSLAISQSPIPTLSIIPTISTIPTQSTVPTLSPSSYLASTIANLKNRIASKPILSKSFIDRINRYITF